MTMNTFNFNGHQFRSTMIEGEPWFVAVDACRALGFNILGGVAQYMRHIEADDRKTVFKNAAPKSPTKYANPLINFQGVVWGRHEAVATLISESGLYKLIMRSDKPEAVAFQNWLTKEVLPSIRKTGGYLLNEAARTTAHADTKEAMPLPLKALRWFPKQPIFTQHFCAFEPCLA